MHSRINKHLLITQAEAFCAYQERCSLEVRRFLSKHTTDSALINEAVNHLTEQGFLDDNRYCAQFAGGKFRIKKWGRIKIRHALFKKGLPADMIESALEDVITEEAYLSNLRSVIAQYRALHGEVDVYKLMRFLLSKGYEQNLIMAHINT